jgi:PKD repeat protein
MESSSTEFGPPDDTAAFPSVVLTRLLRITDDAADEPVANFESSILNVTVPAPVNVLFSCSRVFSEFT